MTTAPVGYRLIDENGFVLASWGGSWGQTVSVPDHIDLPNGDRVFCPEVGAPYPYHPNPISPAIKIVVLEVWEMEEPSAPVPESISDRQFAYAIALMPDRLISLDEAEEWSAIGTLPQIMVDVLDMIPEVEDGIPKRALARGKLRSATEYRRNDELTVALAPLLGKDGAYLDAIWRLGATI